MQTNYSSKSIGIEFLSYRDCKFSFKSIYLIESDGVESKAQVKKSDGNAIKNAKEHDSFHVNCLALKEIQALCGMESAKCYHQMPTCECCR